jgi:nicotinate-nucleotide pyrophosphorylase (carboxylating)
LNEEDTEFENQLIQRIVDLALDEDKVHQDVTTNSLLEYDKEVLAQVTAKEDGIISGIKVFEMVFKTIDQEIAVQFFKANGSLVKKGDLIVQIRGRESGILKAERTALNFLQRLSGIATLTRKFVDQIKESDTKLLDTRKTSPGMRYLEKKAVKDGGGNNHRMNLEDMAMVKDNHIRMAGTISKAVQKIRNLYPNKKIEVEVKDLVELQESLSVKADIIMLDNFNQELIAQAVRINNHRAKLEISGNVSLENVSNKALQGIDYISVGALTHSFKSLDLSLNVVTPNQTEEL